MDINLRHIVTPAWPVSGPPPELPDAEYAARADALYRTAGADWVLVYGDREHAANLVFVCGLDPRFEEAVLVLGPGSTRALLLGNEDMGYTSAARLPVQAVLCQSLSLMGQPRTPETRLDAVLGRLGIGPGAKVGVVGWKYLEEDEDEDALAPAFVPAFLSRVLARLTGPTGRVIDATAALMHPSNGLKSRNGASQIAAFEWSAVRASDAVQRVVRGARPGMREYDAAAAFFQHGGQPYSCHPMLTSAGTDEPVIGLRSPGARVLGNGDGMSTAVGYWGSLCARAGLLRAEPDPAFVEQVVKPYYRAIATWYQNLAIGVTGGEIHHRVMKALAGATWQPALNPGHLVSIDEWTHTPIRPGSADGIGSGMALQCDIIPAPMPNGWALNCEDTVAIADAGLRADIAAAHPDLWRRIQDRRQFMRDALGLVLSEDVLPLSNAPACLAPFWLDADLICAVA
ncbi:MAG: M24 family metallopeptidase [Thermoflexales bacterium]